MKPRKIAASVTVGLAIAGLADPPPLYAFVVQSAPEFSVDLASGNFIGLRSRYLAYANVHSDYDAQTDSLTKLPFNWTEKISHAGSVSASPPSTPDFQAFAEFQGVTRVGKLSARTHARIENGFGQAHATLYMQFMDIIQVDKAGKLNFDWVVSGSANSQRHPVSFTSGAGSAATAELFVWQHGVRPPTTGSPFPFSDYARSSYDGLGEHHIEPEGGVYAAGSRWWVLGQLTITSSAQSNILLHRFPPNILQSTAAFGDTAELFISPDPSTPEASFHSASGFNYRVTPVPEAATVTLMATGMLVVSLVMLTRRRRYRRLYQPFYAERRGVLSITTCAGRSKIR